MATGVCPPRLMRSVGRTARPYVSESTIDPKRDPIEKAAVVAAAQTGGWLVFAGHEIGSPGHQTNDATVLEQFLKYAADHANGIWLDTVENISRYIQEHRGGK